MNEKDTDFPAIAETLNIMSDMAHDHAVYAGLIDNQGDQSYSHMIDLVRRIEDECDEAKLAAWNRDADAFSYELADIILTALSTAGEFGIDIGHYVTQKHQINLQRGWKHGKEG